MSTAEYTVTGMTCSSCESHVREEVAQISGVTVGGKTGTARSDGKRPPYAWFVAWANDPKVAVAVFVQDSGATTAETSGGRFAGPIAKRVIEALR